MSAGGDFGNPLRKFKLVFLGEQSGECAATPFLAAWSRLPRTAPGAALQSVEAPYRPRLSASVHRQPFPGFADPS